MQEDDVRTPYLGQDPNFQLPLVERNGYEIFSGNWGKQFIISQRVNSSLVRLMQNEHVGHVVLLGLWVAKNIDLSFLRELPELRAIGISSYEPIDWRPLQTLHQLEHLSLTTKAVSPQPIDFTKFSNLRECELSWHSQWSSVLQASTIRHLAIEDSKKVASFDLTKLPSLNEFFAVRCNGLRELVFERSQRLRSLKIARCRSFCNVTPRKAIADLEFLYLEAWSRFDLNTIGKMKSLRRLWLNALGKIPSIRFLKGCKNLQRLMFHFGTNVLDGDLAVLQELPHLRKATYDRTKRHYHPKYADAWFAQIARRSPI